MMKEEKHDKRYNNSQLSREITLCYRKINQKYRGFRYKKLFLFLLIASIIYVYKKVLDKHGTIAPPATWYFTKPFNGLNAYNYPPNNWKPNFRIAVTLTTTPNRLSKIEDSINSLLQQNLNPDIIYLNVPSGKMKRHPEKSYDEVEIPKSIKDNKAIEVIRSLDYGPATKLIPALLREKENSTLIITVDDDFVYPKELVQALAWEASHNKDVALGICGWGTMPVPGSIGMVAVYVPYFMRPNGRYVDILQACCGNAYRRGFFSDIKLLADIPPICITVDDVWIAGYLAIIEQRKHAIISKRLDPEDPFWKAEESNSLAAKMKLSNFNDANEIHYQCLLEMERKFGKPWKRIYQQNEI